jgi:hypothetical protein
MLLNRGASDKIVCNCFSRCKMTHAQCWERRKVNASGGSSVEALARARARSAAVRLQRAAAAALNHRAFTKVFLEKGLLHAMINQAIPARAIHAQDVLEFYRDFGLEGPHTLFHASDVSPALLSNLLRLAFGQLHPGGELTHLQPWRNCPRWHQHSDQKVVHARPTLMEALSFVAARCRWISGTHCVYFFLPNNRHHHLFKQFYLNGTLPSPGMNGHISMFACAPGCILPSGCLKVIRAANGVVVDITLTWVV